MEIQDLLRIIKYKNQYLIENNKDYCTPDELAEKLRMKGKDVRDLLRKDAVLFDAQQDGSNRWKIYKSANCQKPQVNFTTQSERHSDSEQRISDSKANNAMQFIKIDPKHQDLNNISHQNGIYIFTLRKGCDIPDTHNKPIYELYDGQRVLYIGQTKSGLNSRINKKHFNGRAGSSTLRKSLGCLLGFKLIPRSKKNPDDGKTTFEKCDEIKLSQWMRDSLIVYYAIVLDDIDSAENKFINSYSPPLNLSKVPMDRNQGFRSELSSLRSMK